MVPSHQFNVKLTSISFHLQIRLLSLICFGHRLKSLTTKSSTNKSNKLDLFSKMIDIDVSFVLKFASLIDYHSQ